MGEVESINRIKHLQVRTNRVYLMNNPQRIHVRGKDEPDKDSWRKEDTQNMWYPYPITCLYMHAVWMAIQE